MGTVATETRGEATRRANRLRSAAMFFFLPWGHDQPVYDRPWLTYALVTACTAIFLVSAYFQVGAERDLEDAALRVEARLERAPAATVSFTVSGMPEPAASIVADLTDTARPGDPELEAAVLDVVAAMNRMPTFRFGWKPASPSVRGALGHAFMHADVFHLLGNMLLLFLAGSVLECFWRRWAYALLYVVAGACGLAAHHFSDPTSTIPVIGASGAIAGLLGAFVIGYPRTRIRIFYFFLFPLFRWGNWNAPAFVVIPLWAGIELLHGVIGSQDGVAYWAHVGGFACGAIAALIAHRAGLVAADAGFEIARDPAPPPPQHVPATRRSLRPVARDVAPIELPPDE
jgi:membrane associated rhomboid family serine protease